MKILVLGATGMLGHKVIEILSTRFEVVGSVRSDVQRFQDHPVLGQTPLVGHVRVDDFDSMINAFSQVRPEAVVNCIGVIKQAAEAQDPLISLAINSVFPHRLSQLCKATGSRLIHISTDCVFSGKKGSYTEDDISDAEDLYGRTKVLGEAVGDGTMTLRTSFIGRELGSQLSLVDWFISQRGQKVNGYTQAIYTGFTSYALGTIIADILENHEDLSGLWHVSSDRINKYELLKLVNEAYDLGITIEPDVSVVIDRSLDSARFRRATGFVPTTWLEMVAQMAADAPILI